ncbi:hypothetical protein GCM10009630_59660 [Kribbella jejuensis]
MYRAAPDAAYQVEGARASRQSGLLRRAAEAAEAACDVRPAEGTGPAELMVRAVARANERADVLPCGKRGLPGQCRQVPACQVRATAADRQVRTAEVLWRGSSWH